MPLKETEQRGPFLLAEIFIVVVGFTFLLLIGCSQLLDRRAHSLITSTFDIFFVLKYFYPTYFYSVQPYHLKYDAVLVVSAVVTS